MALTAPDLRYAALFNSWTRNSDREADYGVSELSECWVSLTASHAASHAASRADIRHVSHVTQAARHVNRSSMLCSDNMIWSPASELKMHTSEWKIFNWFNWSLHFIANKYSVFVLCILRVDIAIQCGIEKWSIRDLETFSQRLENFLSLNIWAQSQVISLPKALGSRRILTKDIRTGL